MRASVRLYQVGVGVAVLLLPLKIGGCGNTACFTVTAAQLAQNSGACPSPGDALTRFTTPQGPVTEPSCQLGGGVALVDGPGELDGDQLCCYPVELANNAGEDSCGNVGEGVGSGVFMTGGVGVGGSSTVSAVSTVGTGFGGGPGCGGFPGFGGSSGFGGFGGGGFGGSGGVPGNGGALGAGGAPGSGGIGGA